MSHLGNTSDLDTQGSASDLIIAHNGSTGAHGMSTIGTQVSRAPDAATIRTLIGVGGGAGGDGVNNIVLGGNSTVLTANMKGKLNILHTGDNAYYTVLNVIADEGWAQPGDTFVFMSGGLKIGAGNDYDYHTIVFKYSSNVGTVTGDVFFNDSDTYTFMFGPPGSICVITKGFTEGSKENWVIRGDSLVSYVNAKGVTFKDVPDGEVINANISFANSLVRQTTDVGDIIYSLIDVPLTVFPPGCAVTVSSALTNSTTIQVSNDLNIYACDGYFTGGSEHVITNVGDSIQIIRESLYTYTIIGNVTST